MSQEMFVMVKCFRSLVMLYAFLVLQACGGGSGGGGAPDTVLDNNSQPNTNTGSAATLNTIGDKSVTPGSTVNFIISALNDSGHDITFSTNMSSPVYTRNATFNASTGQFNWITSSNDEDTYQVTFTVTDNDVVPVASDSKTITISVLNPSIAKGLSLYEQHCESCHGTGGVGGSQTLVLGSGPLYVRQALGLEAGIAAARNMGGIASSFANSTEDATAIGYYLCDAAGVAINDVDRCPL